MEIELQDENGNKLEPDAFITANFKIVLSLKGSSNLDKITLNHEIEIAPSPETLWNEFINSISKDNKLNDLSLTDFTNKNKWDDVLKAIREKLAIKFKEIFNNDSDLKIALQDKNDQPLYLENEIGLDYLNGKKIKIVLSYGKKKSLNNSFEIGFKVLSPLTKFIKSLKDKKQLQDFYDLDNWAKLEAVIQKIIDTSIFKDLITFEPIDKSKDWKVGNNQALKVKFKQKKTSYEEEVEFKYNVVLSLFTKYLNRINKSSIGEITYNHNYEKNPNKFIEDYRKRIKEFFEKKPLNDQIPDYEILTQFDFETGTKDIDIKITYQGVIRHVTLRLVLKKLALSDYIPNNLSIEYTIDPEYDETAFEKSSINKREIIEKVIKALKDKVKDFKNIDIDEYMNYFDFKEFDNIYADFDGHTYTLDFISTLNKYVEGKIKVKLNAKKNSVRLNDLAKIFLEQLKKNNPELFKFEINNDYKFYFDSDGLKNFARLKAKYEELITKRMNEILYDDKYWLGKILKEQKITGEFEFDNFDISDNYEFSNTNFNMTMKYRGKNQTNKFTFKDTRIANLLKFEINTNEVKIETAKKFLDDLDKYKQTHKLHMMKEDTNKLEDYFVTGLMNDHVVDWINIKKFIDNGFATNTITKRTNLLKNYGFDFSRELSNSKNGYFYYSANRNLVLNVKVDKYNNRDNYKDEPNELSFSTGKIEVKLYTLTNKNKINGSWLLTEKKYDLINRAEWEWYAKLRSKLDNEAGYKNSLKFKINRSWKYIIDKWLVGELTYWPFAFDEFITSLTPGIVKEPSFSHFENDHIVIKFGIEGKPIKSNYKHGFAYALKLGGTGHIAKLQQNKMSLYDENQMFRDSLKKANLEKVDLKFRLYRTDDPHKTSEDSLLPIGKDVNYILA